MEIIILVVIFGLAILPVALFRYFRRNKNIKTKEERRAETLIALVILAILFLIVFIRQSVLNDQKENIIQDPNTSQIVQ
ncbi:MAG: hypothetical protein PWQ10_278 [Patescibacteria group bacterium]|nr:hypothetical protein [Patescibacteria group bacterium]